MCFWFFFKCIRHSHLVNITKPIPNFKPNFYYSTCFISRRFKQGKVNFFSPLFFFIFLISFSYYYCMFCVLILNIYMYSFVSECVFQWKVGNLVFDFMILSVFRVSPSYFICNFMFYQIRIRKEQEDVTKPSARYEAWMYILFVGDLYDFGLPTLSR